VESLNGVRNRSASAGEVREADPEFTRALQLIREVQLAGAVGLRVDPDASKGQGAVLFFRQDDVPDDVVAKSAEIRRLLRLSPTQQKFALTYSPARGGEGELAVNSRSMLQIMVAFSSYLDVPEAHVRDHSALPGLAESPGENRGRVRIHSGKDRPVDAYAAVRYRGYWFWIDEGDTLSKRALTAVMFFFTLTDTGSGEKVPLITIPAQ
jgi:hypothetical protein